jgi:hypothetical protein
MGSWSEELCSNDQMLDALGNFDECDDKATFIGRLQKAASNESEDEQEEKSTFVGIILHLLDSTGNQTAQYVSTDCLLSAISVVKSLATRRLLSQWVSPDKRLSVVRRAFLSISAAYDRRTGSLGSNNFQPSVPSSLESKAGSFRPDGFNTDDLLILDRNGFLLAGTAPEFLYAGKAINSDDKSQEYRFVVFRDTNNAVAAQCYTIAEDQDIASPAFNPMVKRIILVDERLFNEVATAVDYLQNWSSASPNP